MRSIRTLLAGIVDYAGLFPPADLPMASAVGNYARYLDGPNSWMLGRFVLPAARLDEFNQVWARSPRPWELSVLCDSASDLARIEVYEGAQVLSLERKINQPHDVWPPSKVPEVYSEFPLSSDPQPFLSAILGAGSRAKIRTGGVTADSIPGAASLARFLVSAAQSGVPFKATAGLHHPLRGMHRLAPDPDSPRAKMHCFLNLFLAAAFAKTGARVEEIIGLLEETSFEAFIFKDESIAWRSRSASDSLLKDTRRHFAISFGSCSFEDPIADLRGVGLL